MPMFWSKKSKADKNYDAAKGAPIGTKGKAPKAKKAPIMEGTVATSARMSAAAKEKVIVPKLQGNDSHIASVILRPHITEKSGLLSQGGVYTFQVSAMADRSSVAKAVAALYKVTPIRVALINNPSKRVFVRGKRGMVSGVRKAMVTVKKGEKIDFV